MTDPLLTIDDATREFRASPKTIRRRLVAGEIEGAYKRPGSRGPEWVMPRSSLVAAGFARRNITAPVEIPSDPEAQAGYWEQRALDAEAALEVARQGGEAPGRPRPWPYRWAFAAGLLGVGLIAGLLMAGGGDEASPAVSPDAAHEAARATLGVSTASGDVLGVVGRVPDTVLPAGRELVLLDMSALSGETPRYLVAVTTDEDPGAWAQVRGGSEVVARVPIPEGTVEVLDRGPNPVMADTGGPHGEPPPEGDDAAAVDDDPAMGPAAASEPPAGDVPAVVRPGTAAVPPASAPLEITVDRGDSFWTVAVALAGGGDREPSTPEVAAVWSALIDANVDRLVDPGNPDLVHVGQTLVVPPLP